VYTLTLKSNPFVSKDFFYSAFYKTSVDGGFEHDPLEKPL